MGVDFTAIMDHGMTWEELYELPAALNREVPLVSDVDSLTKFLGSARRVEWHWRLSRPYSNVQEEIFEERYVTMDGPVGFSCTVHERGVEITHLCRWWLFLTDAEVRCEMRQAMRQIARVFESRTIIYLPDSAFPPSAASDLLYDGVQISEIEHWLKSRVDSPIDNDAALASAIDSEMIENVYFIDRVGLEQ